MHYVLIKCTGKRKKVLENVIESTWFGANFGTNKCSNLNWFMYVTVPFFFFEHPSVLTEKRMLHRFCFSVISEGSWERTYILSASFSISGGLAWSLRILAFPNYIKAPKNMSGRQCLYLVIEGGLYFFLSFEQYCDIHPRCLVGFCVASMLSIFLILCYRKVKF